MEKKMLDYEDVEDSGGNEVFARIEGKYYIGWVAAPGRCEELLDSQYSVAIHEDFLVALEDWGRTLIWNFRGKGYQSRTEVEAIKEASKRVKKLGIQAVTSIRLG